MKHLYLFVAIAALLASSCNIINMQRIKGNGHINTKTYDLQNFNAIDAGGNVHVYLKQDSVYSVKLQTDENLFKYITIKKDDGNTVDIQTRNGYNLSPTDKIKVFISMPEVRDIDLSGATKIETEGKFVQNSKVSFDISGASHGEVEIKSPEVHFGASGASSFIISGETRDAFFEASGASTIKAFDLLAENSRVGVSGASNANVYASIELNAEASGASNVRYKGNPKTSISSSGASSVKKVDE
ncbi:MAG: head GIN domain-containing protein [Niabella sp.]